MCLEYFVRRSWRNLGYFSSTGKIVIILLTIATLRIQIITASSENPFAADETSTTNEEFSDEENLILKICYGIYKIGTTMNITISFVLLSIGGCIIWVLKFRAIGKKTQTKDTESDMEYKPKRVIVEMQECDNCDSSPVLNAKYSYESLYNSLYQRRSLIMEED